MIKKSFFISIFPKIFNEILGVGIAKKALDNGIIDYEVVNPMNFLDHKKDWMIQHMEAVLGCC